MQCLISTPITSRIRARCAECAAVITRMRAIGRRATVVRAGKADRWTLADLSGLIAQNAASRGQSVS